MKPIYEPKGKAKDINFNNKLWKQMPHYEHYYVSNDGEIISTHRNSDSPRLLKPIKSKDGHQYVFMYEGGKQTKIWVHRAVLTTWCRLPKDGELGRHLNDNPKDNRIENLSWGTAQDNMNDKVLNGKSSKGEDRPTHKLNDDSVMQIREKYADGIGSFDLAKEYGVAQNTILGIVKGRNWTHLPLVPIRKRHIVKRRAPMTQEERENHSKAMKKVMESIKRPRFMVPCECGCGTMIKNIGSDGRPRKFAWGHNMRKQEAVE